MAASAQGHEQQINKVENPNEVSKFGWVQSEVDPAPRMIEGGSVDLLWWTWALTALGILGLSAWVGRSLRGTLGGVLIDSRGRYSLSRFQLLLWTLVLIPVIAGFAAGRFSASGIDPLEFSIPIPVLALFTTAGATSVVASAVKSHKNRNRAESLAANPIGKKARFVEIFLVEEGENGDQNVDLGKFQSLVVTVLLGSGYVLTVAHDVLGLGTNPMQNPADLQALPDINATFVALLAISSAGYLMGKTVPQAKAPSFSLKDRFAQETLLRTQERENNSPVDNHSVRINRNGLSVNTRRPPYDAVREGSNSPPYEDPNLAGPSDPNLAASRSGEAKPALENA